MKKLLSILAAVGLTATSSAAVVSCANIAKGNAVVDENGNVQYTSEDIIMPQSFVTTTNALAKEYGVFDKDGKKVNAKITPIVPSSTEELKRDASYKFKVTFTMNAGKVHKKNTYFLGTIGKDKVSMDTKLQTIKPKFVSSAQQNATPVVNQVAKTQKFAVATLPETTFKTVPTSQELEADFAVTDQTTKQPIKGVKYSFIPSTPVQANNKLLSLAEGVMGTVAIKVPHDGPAATAAPIKVDTTPAGKEQLPDFQPVEPKTTVFTEDAVNVNVSKLTTTDKNGKQIVKALAVTDIISNMSDSTAKDVYEGIHGVGSVPANGNYKSGLGMDSLTFHAAKGMSITPETVNKQFNSSNGTLISNSNVIPDGSQYQIGLSTDAGKYYWFDMSFDTVVTGTVSINALSIKGDTIKATLSNEGQFIGKDINQYGLVDINLEGKQLSQSDIKSTSLDEAGNFVATLKTPAKTGQVAKVKIANIDANGNKQWTESAPIEFGQPVASQISIVDGNTITAQITNDDALQGKDLATIKGGMLLTVDGQEMDSSNIKSAIVDNNGMVSIKLKEAIKRGDSVQLAVADTLQKQLSKTGIALWGNPTVTNTTIVDSKTVTAYIHDNDWLKGKDLAKEGLLEFFCGAMKDDKDQNKTVNGMIKSAKVDESGNLTVKLKDDHQIEKGCFVKLNIANSKGGYVSSDKAVYGMPKLTNMAISEDATTITAVMTDNFGVTGTTGADLLATKRIRMAIDGNVFQTESIKEAKTDKDGVVTIKLQSPLSKGNYVQLQVADALGQWSPFVQADIYGTPAINNLQVVNSTTITAQVFANDAVKNRELTSDDIKMSLENGAMFDGIATASVDNNGLLTATLSKSLKPGQYINISMKDALGNWSNSNIATWGTPEVSNLAFADKDNGSVLTADVANNDVVMGTDLLSSGSIKVLNNGYGWNSESIKRAYVGNNGTLAIELKTPVAKGQPVQVSVKDVLGNWTVSNIAAYGTPSLSDVTINDANTLTTTISNSYILDNAKNADLSKENEVKISVNGGEWTTKDIKSAIVNQGKLTVELNKGILGGDEVAVSVQDPNNKESWISTSAKLFGQASVSDVKVVTGDTDGKRQITAKINDDSFITNENISNNLTVFKNGVSMSLASEVWSVTLDKNNVATITLSQDLNYGDVIQIRVLDRLGNWSELSDGATCYKPSQYVINSEKESDNWIDIQLDHWTNAQVASIVKGSIKMFAKDMFGFKTNYSNYIAGFYIDKSNVLKVVLTDKVSDWRGRGPITFTINGQPVQGSVDL